MAPRIEIDGQRPSAQSMSAAILAGYGHFTALQVRDHRVRGLALHLARLDTANRELFGQELDGDRVCQLIRHALGPETPDASVRVHVQELDPEDGPSVMVIIRPPGGLPGATFRLQSVPYQRSLAHIKHIGDFGQTYYHRFAVRNGFDEALLTGPDGAVSEGALCNVGFFDGTEVIWPAAPLLTGTTMALIDANLASHGMSSRRQEIRLADVGTFTSAFITSSRGIAPVTGLDGEPVPVDAAFMKTLTGIYDAVPWDPF